MRPADPGPGSAPDTGPDTGPDTFVTLDGTSLTVRPIAPGDADRLVELHARLSGDTIYRRYFGVRPALAPSVVARFTQVPEEWRFALVAVREPDDLVAVARYEGSPGATGAELAVVVDDALQHHGVGRAMVLRLVDVAAVRGLDTLVAEVLVENKAMLGLLRRLDVPFASREGDETTRVLTLDLRGVALDAQRRARALAHVRRAEAMRAAAPGAG
ncbi:MAG: N-acetyltransferase family protein [Pseudonocardia sp.]